MTGLPTASLYKEMREGRFPEPVRISARSVRWHRAEVEAWLASRPRASGQAEV